jgi:hypothetical protein
MTEPAVRRHTGRTAPAALRAIVRQIMNATASRAFGSMADQRKTQEPAVSSSVVT